MPELPDIEAYRACLGEKAAGRTLIRLRIAGPFLVRTVDPPIEAVEGRTLRSLSRIGKRLVFHFDDDLHLVLHLMIAGRLLWKEPQSKPPGRITLAQLQFDNGQLILTEAGTKKRASLHLVRGADALAALDPGGREPLEISSAEFSTLIRRENHTLKRTLTNPRLIAGIGNAFSDEILHAARLSPISLTSRLKDEHVSRLHEAMIATLTHWRELLTARFLKKFPGPGDVTAFRPEFAVHGKFGKPCPVCDTAIQRIRYADNETNYCPRCQTEGRVLADRSLSRLLRDEWPRTVEELEA